MTLLRLLVFVAAALLASPVSARPVSAQPARLSLDARETPLPDVLRLLAIESGMNVVADGSVKPIRVTIHLQSVTLDEALTTLGEAYGLQIHRGARVVVVGDATVMSRKYPADGSAFMRTAALRLQHATPEEVKSALADALAPGTLVMADRRRGEVVVAGSASAIERARALVAGLDVAGDDPVRAETVQLRNIKATDAAKALKSSVPDNALVADDRANIVVVSGSEATRASTRALLVSIDNPGKQVMFEVRVADVEPQIDTSNVGVEFGGAGFGSGALAQVPYTLTKSSVVLNAQLNALIQRGHASILAQPRIATLNNREATLLVGETYPVVTTNAQTGYPTVTNIDIGVKLRLTPTIGDDGSVTAELHPEYSQISGFNNAFPIVANRRVDATLRVRDGETIVLGGLFSDVDADTVTKLPLLGDVPVLGGFFRNRQRQHSRDEVVFYITPHVLP